MNRERWDRLQELYAAASQLDGQAQREYLEAECGSDAALLEEILGLLQQTPPPEFVEPPAGQAAEELFGLGLSGRDLGDFVLRREIGRGGMGVVYQADQKGLSRPVAVKVLPLARRDEDSLARFEREARAASSLDHPHIVPILASGELDGLAWYAMRFVPGHDLAAELKNQRAARWTPIDEDRFLPAFGSGEYIPAVCALVKSLAEALQSAHDSGVVHRDVKPSNVLIDTEGQGHLADFGLAKDERFGTLSVTGEVRGTPSYMSPEQAAASRARVDHRTDVYSLSVVLYEMLCLRLPYTGDTAREVITKITNQDAPRLRRINPRVPRDLGLICAKGMSRQAGDRYATAGDMAEDLARFLRHEAVVAKPPGLARQLARFVRKYRFLAGALGTALLAVAIGINVAEARAGHRQRAELAERIEAIMALEDWSGATGELAALRERALALRTSGRARELALEDELTGFLERLDRFRAECLAEADHLFERGVGGVRGSEEFGDYRSPAYDQDVALAMRSLGRLSAIFSDDEEVRRAADAERTFPRVSLAAVVLAAPARPADAAVATWRPIDPYHDSVGAEESLGPLPLVDVPVPPGPGRLEVRVDGIGSAVLTRSFEPGDSLRLEARVIPRDEAPLGMVRIEGGRLDLDAVRTIGCLLVDDAVVIPTFWLDEAEVSNGEFHDFLVASGHPAPQQWQNSGYVDDPAQLPVDDLERWRTLPVVDVSWYDARAYAEYVGKRLPTHTELEFAFRGADAEPGSSAWPGNANIAGERSVDFQNGDARSGYSLYLRNVLPCRAETHRQPPHGLYHAHGNVNELTESFFVETVDGRLTSYASTFLSYGSYWGSQRDKLTLDTHGKANAGPEYRRIHTGFRCALNSWNP